MIRQTIVRACALSALTFVLACGSSGSSGSSGSKSTLNTLNDIPSVNASNYDYSVNGNAVGGLTRLPVLSLAAPVGGFSRAACEGYTLKKQLFQDSRQIEGFLCYIKTLESSNLGVQISNDAWSYYEINFPPRTGENGPPPIVRVRIGKFADELKMDACVPNGADFHLDSEIRFSPTDTGYVGSVVNAYSFTNGDMGEAVGNSKINVTIDGTSVDTFTSAQFDAYHSDHLATDDTMGWTSQMSFSADGVSETNTLQGANSSKTLTWGSNGTQLYGKWGTDLIGSVKYLSTGEYPAPTLTQCMSWGMTEVDANSFCVGKCYNQNGVQTTPIDGNCPMRNEGTESFSIDGSTTPPTFRVVADSLYATEVAAATLPTLADIQSNLGFVDAWDCTSSSFTTVDATGLTTIAATCEPPRDNEMWKMCEEQQQAAQNK